jgi:hypothetical protein
MDSREYAVDPPLGSGAEEDLRIAALLGRDPRDPRMAAEVLALRGVHPTVDRVQRDEEGKEKQEDSVSWRSCAPSSGSSSGR